MPTFEVISGAAIGGGSSSYLVAEKILIDAEIKALPTIFIEIIPAPGPGKAIVFINAIILLNTLAGSYTNINGDTRLLVAYGDWNSNASIFGYMTTDNLGRLIVLSPFTNVNLTGTWAGNQLADIGAYGDIENFPLKIVASNSGGNFTGGNAVNTLKVTVYYVVVDL